jgi:signal transduction histidine kinase
MSDGARAWLGTAGNLVDAMRLVAPAGLEVFLGLGPAARFTPVFQRGDSLWVSAELAGRAEVAARQEALTLLGVQSDFLRNFFRLQTAERQLSTRTRNLRPSPGTGVLFQVERERQRLARELHSGVGQALAAIRLQLEIIAAHHIGASAPVAQALSHISSLAAEALEHVRSVSRWLHPPEWQRLTLEGALQQLWETSGVPQRFHSALRIVPLPAEPALDVRILIYRAAQEGLSNLVRHSRASRVEMTLEPRDGRLVLTVEDDGVGFDAVRLLTTPGGVASGIGLRSLREQATELNAVFSVQSGPNGTKLVLSAPFPGTAI